jgi:hypothetical protein
MREARDCQQQKDHNDQSLQHRKAEAIKLCEIARAEARPVRARGRRPTNLADQPALHAAQKAQQLHQQLIKNSQMARIKLEAFRRCSLKKNRVVGDLAGHN